MNLSGPLLSFDFISELKLISITRVKSDLILSNLPQITDVHFVSFMPEIRQIGNAYNKSFSHGSLLV